MDKRKRADHYHVVTGLPGYLPNENWACETLAEAGNVALSEAKAFREGGYHSCWSKDSQGRVIGNKRGGYKVLRFSLGELCEWQTIRIEPCNEADCRCAGCGALLHEYDCTECSYEHEEYD